MKRDLCLLALALVLSVGVLMVGHIQINRAKDKLEIEEEILLGDPAAYGLTASYNALASGRHLFWNTSFTPGRGDEAETSFRFYASSPEYPRSETPYVELSPALMAHYSSWEEASPTRVRHLPEDLRRYIENLASLTPAGDERTETVPLADFFEIYPLLFGASRDGNEMGTLQSEEGTQAINQYFRLEVDERDVVEITVKKSRNGSISSWNVYCQQSWANLSSAGIITKRGVYLRVNSVDEENSPDSRLQCRDGQGIHFIPARENPAEDEEWYDAAQIHLFYPTEAEILELLASPDESKLLLCTRESNVYVMTVLDAADGSVLQRLELLELEPDEWPRLFAKEPFYLAAVRSSGKFCLVAEENGIYTDVLHSVMDTPEVSLTHATSLDWDGTYLAFTVSMTSFPENRQPDYIGVIGRDGLLCLSRYAYSLNRDPCQHDYLTMAYGSIQPALAASFAEK